MDKHITLVAVLNIGFGFLGLLIAGIIFISLTGAGIISGEPEAIAVTSIVGTCVALFFIIISIPKIIGGIGLLKRKSWSRILILVIAVIDLINIPIGTAIGIYELWVLLNEEAVKLIKESSK